MSSTEGITHNKSSKQTAHFILYMYVL